MILIGFISLEEVFVGPGWNCTTPCGLSLALTVNMAVVASDNTASPMLLLTDSALSILNVKNSASSGSLSAMTFNIIGA